MPSGVEGGNSGAEGRLDLRTEVQELGKQIQEYTLSTDKYFTIATTLVVGIATLALANKFPAALVALPFALGGILLYVQQLFTERAARVGMKKALEESELSRGRNWFAAQEKCLARAVNQSRLSVWFSVVLYALGYLLACVIGVNAATQVDSIFGQALPYVVGVGLALLTAGMGVAYYEMANSEDRAYTFMTEARATEDDWFSEGTVS